MKRLCLVSSSGGHLSEMRALRPAFAGCEWFHVLDYRVMLPADMEGKTRFVKHTERDLGFLVNLWQAWRILRRERPDLIVSTGAAPAVSFGLVGKLLGIPVIFVEISAQVTSPSLSGRLLYRIADRFFYQWRPLARFYPKGVYGGLLG